MFALTYSTIEMTGGSSKTSQFPSAREIINSSNNCTAGHTTISVQASSGKSNPSLPRLYQVINKGLRVMVDFREVRFPGSRDNACQIHVLWFIAEVGWEVQACHRYDATRRGGTTSTHSFHIEEVHVQRESITTFLFPIEEELARLRARKSPEEIRFEDICSESWPWLVQRAHEIIARLVHQELEVWSGQQS